MVDAFNHIIHFPEDVTHSLDTGLDRGRDKFYRGAPVIVAVGYREMFQVAVDVDLERDLDPGGSVRKYVSFRQACAR
jgi:hypothetical protein